MSDITTFAVTPIVPVDGKTTNTRKGSKAGRSPRCKAKSHIVLTCSIPCVDVKTNRRERIEKTLNHVIKRLTGKSRESMLSRSELNEETACLVQYYRIPLKCLRSTVTLAQLKECFIREPIEPDMISVYYGNNVHYAWKGMGASQGNGKRYHPLYWRDVDGQKHTRALYRDNVKVFRQWDKLAALQREYLVLTTLRAIRESGKLVRDDALIPFPVYVQGKPQSTHIVDGKQVPITITFAKLREMGGNRLQNISDIKNAIVGAYNDGNADILEAFGISCSGDDDTIADNVNARLDYLTIEANAIIENSVIVQSVVPSSERTYDVPSSNTIVDENGKLVVTIANISREIGMPIVTHSVDENGIMSARLDTVASYQVDANKSDCESLNHIAKLGYNRIEPFPYACIPVLREDVSEHKWINLAHADFITDCGAFI